MIFLCNKFPLPGAKITALIAMKTKNKNMFFGLLAVPLQFRKNFFFVAHQPVVGQGLLITEASQSHSET